MPTLPDFETPPRQFPDYYICARWKKLNKKSRWQNAICFLKSFFSSNPSAASVGRQRGALDLTKGGQRSLFPCRPVRRLAARLLKMAVWRAKRAVRPGTQHFPNACLRLSRIPAHARCAQQSRQLNDFGAAWAERALASARVFPAARPLPALQSR